MGADGRVSLPAEYGGGEVFLEPREGGLSIWQARPDVRGVYVEVTTRCNLDCAICVRRAWRDQAGDMTPETFGLMVEQLAAFPELGRITFGGYGEPLLHPRIVDMVARAASTGAGVTLVTNGLLLGRRISLALLEARLDTLVVSVDDAHMQAHARAGIADGLGAVLENVRGMRDLAVERGYMAPRIGLEFVVTRGNVDRLCDLPELAKALGAGFALVTNLLPHTAEMKEEIIYDRAEPLSALAGWPVHSGGWLLWGIARLPRTRWGAARRCRFVEERALVIGTDGAVSPCYALMHSYPCYIYGRPKQVSRYVLGRAAEHTLAEIWMGEEYVRFRARVREFRFPSCVDCGMACAYAASNEDCWGNAPSCADCLWAQDILRCP